ncbi:MAG: ferrous iron transport protein B [Bacillota bacterium]
MHRREVLSNVEFPGVRGFRRNPAGRPILVALAGNPNVGKSTVFNSITGLNQHTGNWPGKTVGLFYGLISFEGREYCLVDLPGTYSLRAISQEEEVARDFIINEKPDVTVCVVDATNLERNLNLVFQVRTLTPNCIVCLNLIDEARSKGVFIDAKQLERELGVPVIPAVARDGIGLDLLMSTIASVARVLDKNGHEVRALPAHDCVLPIGTVSSVSEVEVQRVFHEASRISGKVTSSTRTGKKDITEAIDNIVMSKSLGVPLMLFLLGVVFFITLYLSNYPSDVIFAVFARVEVWLSRALLLLRVPSWVHGILVLGVFRTVAWVVAVMFPPMAIFFPMFTLLEDSGYLPRVAFNLDHIFQKCGGHGKQSLSMAMGFGCNAAGVVAARIIESPKERLIAILTNVFVPCNGRFPTLILLASVFRHGMKFACQSSGAAQMIMGLPAPGGVAAKAVFFPQASSKNPLSTVIYAAVSGGAVMMVIVIGVLSTFMVSWVLSKTILKGVPSSFILELPPYRKPKVFQVIARSFRDRTIFVLQRAILVAAPCGAITWLLANTPVRGSTMLSMMAGALEPAGSIMGMDGTILLAFILGFPANEIVIPIALMSYLSQQAMSQATSLIAMESVLFSYGWTWMTAVSVMLFSLLHFPCGTTVYTIYKETGSKKWTALSMLIPTVFACIVLILLQGVFHVFKG